MSSPDAPDLDACLRCNHATHLNEELCAFRDEHDGPVDYCGCPGPDVPTLVAALRAAETKLAAIHTEHQPDGDYGYSTQCTACGTMWPCNTDAILNGKGEPT